MRFANNHTFHNDSYRFGESKGEKIILGKESWVCSNCTITEGAIIPDMSVVAPNTVYTKKIRDDKSGLYAGGSLAKKVKEFDH